MIWLKCSFPPCTVLHVSGSHPLAAASGPWRPACLASVTLGPPMAVYPHGRGHGHGPVSSRQPAKAKMYTSAAVVAMPTLSGKVSRTKRHAGVAHQNPGSGGSADWWPCCCCACTGKCGSCKELGTVPNKKVPDPSRMPASGGGAGGREWQRAGWPTRRRPPRRACDRAWPAFNLCSI